MPRSKDHKTKQKIISVSLDLFYKNGFEKTSIEAIVKKAGLSKGAFFHYFKSKDDLMRAIAEKYTLQVVKIMNEIAEKEGLDAVKKFNLIIKSGQKHKMTHSAEYRKVGMILYDHKNAKFQREILEQMTKHTTPPIEKVINQGVKEGVFDVEFPAETADAYIRFLFMMREPMMEIIGSKMKSDELSKDLNGKLKFFENLLNRILGAKEGTVKLPRINKRLITLVKLFNK